METPLAKFERIQKERATARRVETLKETAGILALSITLAAVIIALLSQGN